MTLRRRPFSTAARRAFGAMLLLLALAVSGTSFGAPGKVSASDIDHTASDPATSSSSEPVRTGTTRVETPAGDPESRGPPSERVAPGDAPRSSAGDLRAPEPPASFNFYDGGWIRFAYPPSVIEHVQPLIAEADAVRAELAARLGQPVLKKVLVYIARTPGEMATLAPANAPYPKYAAGVAYSDIALVLLSIHPVEPNAKHDLAEILRHELAHIALNDALAGRPVPRWFNEGFAVMASGETSLDRYQTLFTATLSDTLLPLNQLEKSFPADAVTAGVAYAEAVDVVRFLIRQQEIHRFNALVERMRKGQTFEDALRDAYSVDLGLLESEWREDVAKRYTFWPVLFSGSIVWAGTIGLFVWAWRRRRRRSKETLERWAREEAAEDALKRRLTAAAEASGRVHIVIARRSAPQMHQAGEIEVPKVEHDGQWHTLH